MLSKFLPLIKSASIKELSISGKEEELYDLLAQPLHEALYKRKSFDFYDELSTGQQLLLAFDYLRSQAIQGGFIQFIHNGYVPLLVDMVNGFNNIGEAEMAKLLDDVLKVFVLNKTYFINAVSVEQFAKLYDELGEFTILDERYLNLADKSMKAILNYAKGHLSEFATIIN